MEEPRYLMDYRRCRGKRIDEDTAESFADTPSRVLDENGQPILLGDATEEQIRLYMPHLLGVNSWTTQN